MPPKKKLKPLPGQAKLTFGASPVFVPSTNDSAGEAAADPKELTSEICASTTEGTSKDSKRHFQTTWLTLYPWLRYEQGKMYCNLCRKHGKSNCLSVGTDNFRTSTLSRHVQSTDHQMIVSAPEEAANMRQVQKTAMTKKEEAVVVALKALFWLCKENLPIAKFRSLMQLLTNLKVPFVEHLLCREKVDYTSDSSADDFLSVLSEVIDENITEKVKQSPVITVFVDESTDIVVHHKLAINVRVVDPLTLHPRTFFLTDVRLSNGTGKGMFDAIKNEFDKRDIPLTKVFGLGTDGASAMTGTKTGLTGQFLKENPHLHNTHCSAHRVALVSEQAAEQVKAVHTFRDTVRSLFYYFHRSPAKVDALESVQKLLDEPVLKYKEVHAIRWLSFYQALDSVHRTIDSLITFFESRKEKDPKAAGLSKKVGQELFISITYGMMDWLKPIMALSLFFQQKDIDISLVKINVQTCITDLEKLRDGVNDLGKPQCLGTLAEDLKDGIFKGHHKVARNAAHFPTVKKDFLEAMISNLQARFQESEKMAQFSVLGMKPLQFVSERDLETWGDDDMQKVADFYCSTQRHIGPDGTEYISPPFVQCDVADVMREWRRCKMIVKTNHYPTHSLTALWGALATLQEQGSLGCPHILKLASLVLTHPVHSCDCERIFSAQNLTLTPLRNRLSAEKCDQMLRVRLEGGDMGSFDFAAAIKKWRRKYRAIFGED